MRADRSDADSGEQGSGRFPRAVLEQEEQRIRGQAAEEFVAVDDAGSIVFQTTGTGDTIRATRADAAKLKGAYVTHNHPEVGSFSDTDVRWACGLQYRELRAVDSKWRYIIEPPMLLDRPGWSKTSFATDVAPAFQAAQKQALRAVRAANRERRLQGIPLMTPAEQHEMRTHETWVRAARDAGLSYRREPFRCAPRIASS